MRNPMCLILICLGLSSCGEQQTPLAHALSAMRAGDHADFLVAKQEAQDDLKNAIQPDGDLCLVTGGDIARYHAVYVINKMDNAEIFSLPEEDRLIYALKYAGRHSVIHSDSPIGSAPIANVGTGHEDARCAGEKDKFMAAMIAGGSLMQADDEARSAVLEGWIDDLKSKYAGHFDDQMRSAASHLDTRGYNGEWPGSVEFADGRGI